MASTFSQSQLFEHLKVVKIIQKIATVLGFSVPNLYNYRGLSGYFLIYAILLCIILICTTALSLYGRFVKTYINDVLSTVILTDVFFYLAPITTYTVSIIWTILFRRRDLLRFVRALRDLEKSLNTKFYFEYKYNENKLFSYFILFESFICSYIFYAILHISIIDFQIKVLLFNLNFFLSIFSMSIICMQIAQHMINLRYMFKFLNRKLYKTINYYSNDKPLNIIGDEFLKSGSPKPNYVEMNFFLKKYDILCDLVDLFAKVYGLQMLFITLTITVMIIRNLNMTLKVALGVAKNIPQHGINFMMGDAVFSSIICVVRIKKFIVRLKYIVKKKN